MITQNIVDLINHHHDQAFSLARGAIAQAKAAGTLLMQVKASLPHGEFTKWIKANLTVSDRQAQRYMAIAQGKPVPIRKLAKDKSVTASVLGSYKDQGIVIEGQWIPKAGYRYVHCADDAVYWIVPNLNDQGFHVSKLYQCERDPTVNPEQFANPDDPYDEREWDGMSLYDGTQHPIGTDYVDGFLRYFGLTDPASVTWMSARSEGFSRPFGEPKSANL